MMNLPRIYESIVDEHLIKYGDKMAFLVGPRQVGKTTLGRIFLKEPAYKRIELNWDIKEHQKIIKSGLSKILQHAQNHELSEQDKLTGIYFDELHKYKKWKSLLRGYQSELTDDCRILVTGSARMDAFKKGGVSLKGISFSYHVFPLSVAELIRNNPIPIGINEPTKIDEEKWQSLLNFGGFPEPYLKSEQSFYNRWTKERDGQLLEQDLRDLEKSIDVKNIQKLTTLLKNQVTSQVKYNTLCNNLNVKEQHIKMWIAQLQDLYYCFEIKPWYNQITKTEIKNPKIYLWDWSELSDLGARYENFVALHLKKAIVFSNDNGGKFELFYLTDSTGEVDFLVTKENKPWLMVEVKSSETKIDSKLHDFNNALEKVPHALQVIGAMPYQELDCFSLTKPTAVPMVTFLSQLV